MLSSASSLLALVLLTSSTLVSAAGGHGNAPNHQHAALAQRARLAAVEAQKARDLGITPPSGAAPRKRGEEDKRCKIRQTPVAVGAAVVFSSSAAVPSPSSSSSSSKHHKTTTTEAAWVAPTTTSEAAWVAPTTTTKEAWVAPTTTTAAPAATTTAASSGGSSSWGTLAVNDATCGWSDATTETSNSGGPNGKESWITCGVNSGGWTPPYVHINELKAADLATVLAGGSSPFGACAPYVDQFYAVGAEFGIPPILVASFAMQESTCNPHAVGGGGEQGMFQITVDKCGGAPGGNCKEVTFNMRTAMKYFSDTLASNGGDAFLSMGMYNGWSRGMTFASATAAQYSSCCRCQNNLDYLHQLTNGWMQGYNGNNFGTYFNLRTC